MLFKKFSSSVHLSVKGLRVLFKVLVDIVSSSAIVKGGVILRVETLINELFTVKLNNKRKAYLASYSSVGEVSLKIARGVIIF